MTGHPRIFVRQADLPRLRGWAAANNPLWNDLLSVANSAKTDMDAGKLNTDNGDGTQAFTPIETYAELFAFMSLVHPDPATQDDYAKRAHDILMKIVNAASLGQADGQPYRGHDFAISNRASWFGEAYAVVLDWAYQKFTAQEKAAIRQVYLRWIQECLHSQTTGYNFPSPVGVTNDPALLSSKTQVRWATNNYYSNHARHIGLLSMSLDAADDVPTLQGDPPGGTLRRFLGSAIGAWLYVQNQYEQTDGVGSIEPEGIGYGELTYRAWMFLFLAMQTTGTDNPQVYGPLATAIANPYWSGLADAYLHMLSPGQSIQLNWVGPAFLPYSFSDDATYTLSDPVRVFGAMAVWAMNTGNSALYGKMRWMIDNLPPGGLNYRDTRILSTYSSAGSFAPAIWYFMATDPNVAAGTDPRPSEANDYFDQGLGIALSRTGWTQNSSWFTYKLSWNAIDHQFGDGNAIGLLRNGEWLTMPGAGYGANIGSSDYQNTVAIQNPGTTDYWFWQPELARGSQWAYDPAGDPTGVHSFTPAYTYAQGDATNLYNNPTISATDVKHASRSVIWLKPDAIVVYDRATTATAGRFKRFFLNTPAQAAINGRSATVTTPGGQSLFVDSLLPANAVLNAAANDTTEVAANSPMLYRLWTEDPSMPADVRFLHVLQGANSGASKAPVSLLASSAGTLFDGALVGGNAVMFRQDIVAPFAGVTFSVPTGTSHVYVTGLTPGAGYSVAIVPAGSTEQITVTAGGALVADAGGVLAF
jgi:hypothetical protein